MSGIMPDALLFHIFYGIHTSQYLFREGQGVSQSKIKTFCDPKNCSSMIQKHIHSGDAGPQLEQ